MPTVAEVRSLRVTRILEFDDAIAVRLDDTRVVGLLQAVDDSTTGDESSAGAVDMKFVPRMATRWSRAVKIELGVIRTTVAMLSGTPVST